LANIGHKMVARPISAAVKQSRSVWRTVIGHWFASHSLVYVRLLGGQL